MLREEFLIYFRLKLMTPLFFGNSNRLLGGDIVHLGLCGPWVGLRGVYLRSYLRPHTRGVRRYGRDAEPTFAAAHLLRYCTDYRRWHHPFVCHKPLIEFLDVRPILQHRSRLNLAPRNVCVCLTRIGLFFLLRIIIIDRDEVGVFAFC